MNEGEYVHVGVADVAFGSVCKYGQLRYVQFKARDAMRHVATSVAYNLRDTICYDMDEYASIPMSQASTFHADPRHNQWRGSLYVTLCLSQSRRKRRSSLRLAKKNQSPHP